MVTRNEKEGWVDYDCKIIVGQHNQTRGVWVEMDTPEFGKMRTKVIKAVDDMKINHQLGESLIDELINEYEFKLRNR